MSNQLLKQLIKKQRKNIPNIGNYGKLKFSDIKRRGFAKQRRKPFC